MLSVLLSLAHSLLILATQEPLDTADPGYQEPLPESEVRPLEEGEEDGLELELEGGASGGGGRGRGRGRGRGGRCGLRGVGRTGLGWPCAGGLGLLC